MRKCIKPGCNNQTNIGFCDMCLEEIGNFFEKHPPVPGVEKKTKKCLFSECNNLVVGDACFCKECWLNLKINKS